MNTDQDMAKAVKLAQAGKLRPAIAVMETVVKRQPSAVVPRYNLALFMLMAGRHADALPHLDRILAADPGHGPSLFSKARGLMALDRAGEALPILERLVTTGEPECLLAHGNALRQLNRMTDAAQAFRRLTTVAPSHPGGHINLCQCLIGGPPEAALDATEQAVRLHPGIAEIQAMSGQVLLRLGRHDAAVARLRKAVELAPGLPQPLAQLLRAYRETADWDNEEVLFQQIRNGLASAARAGQLPFPTQDALFFAFTGEELKTIAMAEAAFRVGPGVRPIVRPAVTAAPPPLVVGYLSPDFREHATMHLAGEVFRHHDRSRVRPIAYSVGPDDGSPWRRIIAGDCDGFTDLSAMGDRQAATAIAADGVHVLVDMSVFTRHARPLIAAQRPAPVQMAWLGLAASSGAPWIDYAILDPVLVPADHAPHFTERLIRLPHTYQANRSWTPWTAIPSRRDLGLPEDRLVLCSFNGHRKLDQDSFHLWLEILGALPDSVLWLLAPPDTARQRLEAAASAAGVDPGRLVWAPSLPHDQHLARLPAADLFIDALVCGAHTTASDCLRMGVPLLTTAGARLGSRVAASLLHAVGLPELVTSSPAEMKTLAVMLGRDRPRLQAIRQRLAELLPASPAFDPARFARSLETAYAEAWARHASGRKPADITVP